jgi:hypothetical protein
VALFIDVPLFYHPPVQLQALAKGNANDPNQIVSIGENNIILAVQIDIEIRPPDQELFK